MYKSMIVENIIPAVTVTLEPSLDGVTLPVAELAADPPADFEVDIDADAETPVALETILVREPELIELKSIVIVVLPSPDTPPLVPLPRPLGKFSPVRNPVIFVNPVSVHNVIMNPISSVQVWFPSVSIQL